MLFEIYYMKPDHFRRFIIGDEKPKVSELPETHTLLARALCAIDLQDVYQHMQAEKWSPNGEARMLIEHLGLQHTSMSVGDVMHRTDTDQFFVVSNIGFTLLEDDRQPAVPTLDPVTFGKLIKKCAFEMNAFDKVLIEKVAIDDGHENLPSVTSGPSVDGNRICQETAKGMGLEPFGELAYYLLAYVWNDALDWADKQTAGYLADLSES